jgi:aminoglycoside phosphotransferase (APT) family kinase protein
LLSIPDSERDLTATWLTQALRTARAIDDDDAVTAIGIDSLATNATTAHVSRVHLTYRNTTGRGPRSVIWKSSPADVARRSRFARGYEREVRFYRELAGTTTVRVPASFAAEFDATTLAHVLLLEDLSSYESPSIVDVADERLARRVVDELALLHAAHWGIEREGPPRSSTEPYEAAFAEGIALVAPYLDAETEPLVPRYLATGGSRFARMADAPRTIVHGDVHLANLMLPAGGEGRPAFVDWQGWRVGTGTEDLGRFLVSSVEPGLRRGIERSLVARYAAALESNGVRDVSIDRVWREYLDTLTQEWGVALFFAARRMEWTEEMHRYAPLRFRRSVEALRDAGAHGLLA